MNNRHFQLIILIASFYSILTYPLTVSGQKLPRTWKANYLENIFVDEEDISIATNRFMQAVPSLFEQSQHNRRILNRLFIDIIDILNESEYQLWWQLSGNLEKMQFISSFWRRRDPTRSTLSNERLFEHYQRLLIARKSYGNSSDRTYDHRGSIFVRYGEADELFNETQMATSSARTQSQIFDTGFRPSVETWFYYSFKPAVAFDFFEDVNGYILINQIDFGLQTLTDEDGKINKQRAYVEIVKRRKLLSPSYQAADFEFRTLKRFGNWSQDNGFRQMGFLIGVESFKNKKKREELKHVVSRILSDLPFVQHISYFENDNNTGTYVVTYGLEQKAIESYLELPNQNVLMSTLVINSKKINVAKQNSVVPIKFSDLISESTYGTFDFELSKGDYYFLSEAINNPTHQHGQQEFIFNKNKRDQGLAISSVLLAENILPEADSMSIPTYKRIIRSSLAIEPTPFRKFSLTDPIFVYFEIYGLKKDGSGSTDFQIEYKVKEAKKGGITGFFKKGGKSTTISNRQSGSTSTDISYSQLDLGKIGKGNFELTVHVRDMVAGKSKDAKISFSLE